MPAFNLRHDRWGFRRVFTIALSLWSVFAFTLLFAGEEKEEADAEPRIIRQGGYVEKVDPDVDFEARLPRIDPLEPAESLKKFHLLPGFHLDQVATEPLIADSVDLAFDENGRMFVAEMIPYSENNSHEFGTPNGRVSVLDDTDGDGFYDRSTVYVDQLVWPTGVMAYDGGIFVASAPDLWYFKDTNGDDKADLREKVLTGYGTNNPNAVPGSIRFRLDHRIHVMTSTSGGELTPLRWRRTSNKQVEPVQARGRDISLHPVTGAIRLESGGMQYGTTYDAWGRKFQSSNSEPCRMIMYEDRYIARNPYYAAPAPRVKAWTGDLTVYPSSPPEPWRIVRMEMRIKGNFSGPVEAGGKPNGYFTAACGVMNYKGDAWPEKYCGQMFICEGAGNLIHRMKMQPDGVSMIGRRVDSDCEFLTSEEIWFRPVQMQNGPDGNLYFADMYREVFEIASAVPPSVKKHLDLSCGNDRGRIYRIAHDAASPPRKPPQLGAYTTEKLVPLLAHPNFWHRNTAARLIYQRQDAAAIDPLKQLATQSSSPLGRMHAMYTLDGLGALSSDIILPRLKDSHPRVREHAIRLSEGILDASPEVRAALCRMTEDDDLRVRYQLAFTLGFMQQPKATDALISLAMHSCDHSWIQVALMSSCSGRAGKMFDALAAAPAWRKNAPARDFLSNLVRQVGRENNREALKTVIRRIDAFPESESTLTETLVRHLCAAIQTSGGGNGDLLTGSGRIAEVLQTLLDQAMAVAENDQADQEKRAASVRTLSLGTFDEVSYPLEDLLAAWQPKTVQVAAIQTLGVFRNAEVADILIDAWNRLTPQVRKEAAEVLFASPKRIELLLNALEDEFIQPSQLDPARIEYLLQYPDSDIRERAGDLLASTKLARREEVVQSYSEVLKKSGKVDRGRKVFRRECSTCHRLEEYGYDLGLPLSSIKDRGRDTILLSTLDPNRDVQPQYLNYVLINIDGLSVTGMITSETATSITLTRAEGENDTVLRTHIDDMVNTGLSIMPEGLEEQVSIKEMVDLIEYLMEVP